MLAFVLVVAQQYLLLAEVKVDRCATEIPFLANLVLKIALVRILNPLWQVTEEDKRWHSCLLEHGDVLNLDVLALGGRGWHSGDCLL